MAWLGGQCIRGSGKSTKSGYLLKSVKNKQYYQHRLAYSEVYGEIPKGIQIHHKCDNKLCINPKHLQALTKSEHQKIHTNYKIQEYHKNMITCQYGHPLDGKTHFIRNGIKLPQRYCLTCHRIRSKIRYAKRKGLQYV
jgi:23S rRNA-/tRNA-specific pseudouridylate synthase